MLIVQHHQTEAEAKRERKRIVRAQKVIDSILEKIWEQPVIPSAEDSYLVVRDGEMWAVAVDDPCLP